MRARSFFYVSASALLFAVAYSIGAHNADAQASASVVDMDEAGGSTWAADTLGRLYRNDGGGWQYVTQFPAPGYPTMVISHGGHEVTAAMPDGRTFDWSFDVVTQQATWSAGRNVFGETVRLQGKTMSGVKSAYRGK